MYTALHVCWSELILIAQNPVVTVLRFDASSKVQYVSLKLRPRFCHVINENSWLPQVNWSQVWKALGSEVTTTI